MTKENQTLTILTWFINGTTTEEVAQVFNIEENDELVNILSDGQTEYEAINEEAGSTAEDREVDRIIEETYEKIIKL